MSKSSANHKKISQILSSFETFVNIIPDHVYWKDRDGVYLGCNDAQARESGFKSKKEVIGKTIYDILPKDEAIKVEAADSYVMSIGEEVILEENMINGKTVLSRKIPLKDDSGKVIGMIGISYDITDRKKQQHELERLRRQIQVTLDAIVANMPGHVFWMDKNGVYLGCNNEQAFALGFRSREEIIGKTLFDLAPKGIAEKVHEIDLQVMSDNKPLITTEIGAYADGRQAIFLSRKVPIKDEKNHVIGLLGISFDITAEKEAERLKAEKLAVEEGLKAAQLMAASIAHEMRTPLGTVSAVAGTQHEFMPAVFQAYEAALAEQKVEEPLSRRVYEYLKESPELLIQVVSGANTFINMMLMKFNPENIKAQNLVKLSMAASVKSAVEIYPMNEDERALVKVDTEHDFEFMGDKTLFDHILFNLLKNALHYLKVAQKGSIEIWLEPGAKENILHFKDTGKGMPSDVLNNLFSNFYSKTRHGTGVGLALCKMIMQEFKGTISCDSVEGEYTHFKMHFPKIN